VGKIEQESAGMTVPGDPSIACSTVAAIAWDKAWADNLDPSGRAASYTFKLLFSSFVLS
jgi:hypothetical protein